MKTMQLPNQAEISSLVASLRPEKGFWLTKHDEPCSDTVYHTEAEAEAALDECDATDFCPVYVELTVGWTPESGGWSYQTGDNSYTGGAYGHPVWAVVSISSESDPDEIADEILDQLADQAAF